MSSARRRAGFMRPCRAGLAPPGAPVRFPEAAGRGGSAEKDGCGRAFAARRRGARPCRVRLARPRGVRFVGVPVTGRRDRRHLGSRPGGRRRDRLFRGAARDTARLHPPARLGPVLHRREHKRLPNAPLRAAVLVRRPGIHRGRLLALDRERAGVPRRQPARDHHAEALRLVERPAGERPRRHFLDQLVEGEPGRMGLVCTGRLPRQRDLGDSSGRHDRPAPSRR